MKTVDLFFGERSHFLVREAFNTLRTNIFFSGKNVKTIVFTSCEAHEGKTTVAIECSRAMAEVGKKVLFVDTDMRKSKVQTRYAPGEEVLGLSQYLSGQASLEDVVYHSEEFGFDVIFAGPYPPDPTCLIDNEAFSALINQSKEQYDYVLIDTPPLGLVIDAALVAVNCDGAILVLDQGKNHYRSTQKVKNQLAKSGCRILGAVLNQTGTKRKSNPENRYYRSVSAVGENVLQDRAEKPKSEKVSVPDEAPDTDFKERTAGQIAEHSKAVEDSEDFEDILNRVGLKKHK